MPTASDAVYFDSNGSCTVDVAAVAASLTVANTYVGSFNFGTNTISTAGNADLRRGAGEFLGSTGGLGLNSGGAQTLTPPPAGTIPNVTKSGAGTTTLASNDMGLTGNVNISAGALASGGRNIALAGDWNNSVGASGFSAGTNTVNLNGAGGSTQIISGTTTFHNLTATGTSARELQFTNGTTQTVTGALTLQGASGQLLRLRSTTAGQTWNVAPTGTRACSFVDVQDGNNLVPPAIAPLQSVDSGNTSWWFGQVLALCWDGATTSAVHGQTSPVTWPLGVLAPGTVRTSGVAPEAARVFAVRNASDQPVRLTATAGVSGPWTVAARPGHEQATLGVGVGGTFTSLDTTTSPSGVLLAGNVPLGGTQLFDLRVGTPIATTAGGATQTFTVTITASVP